MSCAASRRMSLRPIVFSSVAVLCILCLYLMYRSDIQYSHFGKYLVKDSPLCPASLCAEKAQTYDTNATNSTEIHNKQSNPEDPGTITSPTPPTLQSSKITSPTQKIQAAAVDAEPDIIVLIWMYPFDLRFDLNCRGFNSSRCHLTDNKTLYHKAHGVLFHHRNIKSHLKNMAKLPRLTFQKWVWFNMESPANSPLIPEINQAFNLTCNYRLDSDIPVPYGQLEPLTSEDESFKLPAKDKLVCWIVSNWKIARHMRRVDFYNEMKKHIEIHTYGKAFGKQINQEEYIQIMSSCKFYLSFENSIFIDYISEKLYKPMQYGAVPVALGTSRQSYEDHVPADSFIHVDDFSTPKELAERLLYLDKNHSEYMRFFNWTSMFKVRKTQFGREHACKTCTYLQNHAGYQAVKDLKTWYWG